MGHRSGQDLGRRYHSSISLATSLGDNNEGDAANHLFDEASTCVVNKEALLDLKVSRAHIHTKNGRALEALGLLHALLPEAKQLTTNPGLYGRTMLKIAEVLLQLDRCQEAHEAATELVAFTKANYSLEHLWTLRAMSMYASASAKLGHVEEAKANFKDVLTIQTRVLGRDHPDTQVTRQNMRYCGFTEPSG